MLKHIKKIIPIFLLCFVCSSAYSQVGIAFSSGQGIREIVPYRISLSWDFGTIWRRDQTWGLHAMWETSYAIWDGPNHPDLGPEPITDLQAATTGPMLRWQSKDPTTWLKIIPYAELGVGLSWLSETEIEGRRLSLHFQFEDKIGVGLRFGQQHEYDFSVRAYHYSNASIKRPNSGVNLVMASFGVWFPR